MRVLNPVKLGCSTWVSKMKLLEDAIVLADVGCSLILYIFISDIHTCVDGVPQVLAGCDPW